MKQNQKHKSENLFDFICCEIGFDKKTKELREAIKEFGKSRYEEGVKRRENMNEKIDNYCMRGLLSFRRYWIYRFRKWLKKYK